MARQPIAFGKLRTRPEHNEAHNNLGVALAGQGQLAEAAAIYRQVLAASGAPPRRTITWVWLSRDRSSLPRRGELRSAPCNSSPTTPRRTAIGATPFVSSVVSRRRRLLSRTLRLNPRYAEAHNNLAIVRVKQGNVGAALPAYGEAIRLSSDYAEAHTNRALAWLQLGDFEQGWPEYEWRWKTKDFVLRRFAQPRWDGGSLEGKTILLYTEQGMGDTIQFVRYAPLLRSAAPVVVEAPTALVPLLLSCEGIDQLVPQGTPLPEFDVQCPLLSLPALTGTRLDSMPSRVPYLGPDPERVQHWGARLRAIPGFKIGIAWQGSTRYQDDRFRSIPLKHFEPLAKLPGVRLVSLQKGYGSEQLAGVAGSWPVVDLGKKLDESGGAFLDTAAVLTQLDLVVTSDTSLAHLAGRWQRPSGSRWGTPATGAGCWSTRGLSVVSDHAVVPPETSGRLGRGFHSYR